ncbi:acetaldehyde dehydrogenase (acetylating) [Miniphocaeibacter halophilus]|uniref:Acetaldehyde dehydrogenase (Acetylating) n=1 Tax=Miniphocaeibacter halophilus TaxID=2931922 RepID=A0AC61MPY7_9FIRM|nr:acetaldehyde dehydrogenase (acetylating) [Miniphocaeibacter halophilus]QQK07599.1 acetaldehyde dehydrogenase (acetylating) [Miniphocaeibacter halophilus]
MKKIKVGIIGPGNIGQDLMIKIGRSKYLELTCVVNIRESKGLERARKLGVDASPLGVDYLIEKYTGIIDIVFDATSAKAHLSAYKKLQDAGMFVLDLTPAAVGPYCVPAVNLDRNMLREKEVNLVTCAGQATTPLVNAINEVADVYYAEIVSSLSSDSAGAGTRANIDEFTETTKKALETIGGADKAKAIIILNPADPPIYMSNTIYTRVKDVNMEKITKATDECINRMKEYVPGVRYKMTPTLKDLNDDIVMLIVEVEGLGDYLPIHSGNLDIINASAIKIAEEKAKELLGV